MAPKFGNVERSGISVPDRVRGRGARRNPQAAVDGYHRVPHGGVETGGILFGTHDEPDAHRAGGRLHASTPKARHSCFPEGRGGPGGNAQVVARDPELAALEPVGWYRAHTRSEILLSDADLAFFERFFPATLAGGVDRAPRQLRAHARGFFFREPGGTFGHKAVITNSSM